MTSTSSLANHTLEAFRAQAGIKDEAIQLTVYNDSFLLLTRSGKYYEIQFRRGNVDIAIFKALDTGRLQNYEEAKDLIAMLRKLLPDGEYRHTLTRLEKNLPSIRLGETPILTYDKR